MADHDRSDLARSQVIRAGFLYKRAGTYLLPPKPSTFNIYVQRKVRIGTIPELYLRIVRIPTLSADSGIVPDNSRIAQGVFYRFLL